MYFKLIYLNMCMDILMINVRHLKFIFFLIIKLHFLFNIAIYFNRIFKILIVIIFEKYFKIYR